MLTDDLDQCWMLTVRDVVKDRQACRAAEHTEDSVDLPCEYCTLGKFLTTKSSFIDFYWSRQLQVGQHLSLHEEAASLTDELEILNDLVTVTNDVLSQSRPYIVNPKVNTDVEGFNVQVAQRCIHGDTLGDSTATALPD